MSGAVFAAKGVSGGAVSNTVYFGVTPDKYNMLTPLHTTSGFTTPVFNTYTPANFGNQWIVFNSTASFGAFTTAPDGTTNTAQKLVESSDGSPTQHVIQSGFFVFQQAVALYSQRIQFFAKPAERTRIACYYQADFNTGGGVKVVFDLAGVQVGSGPTGTNAGSGPTFDWSSTSSASITKYGTTGWLLCTLDVGVNQSSASEIIVMLMPDAGSGIAAENTSYTGNGTSGLYLWRTTSLPPGAWSMGRNLTFGDEYNDNTMAEFDLAQTQGPGFKWWLTGNFLGQGFRGSPFNEAGPSNSANYTVGSSLLTMNNLVGNPSNNEFAWTLQYNPAVTNVVDKYNQNVNHQYYSSYIDQPPITLEASLAINTVGGNPTAGELALQYFCLEELMTPNGTSDATQVADPTCFDAPGGTVQGFENQVFSNNVRAAAAGYSFVDGTNGYFSVWRPDIAYGTSDIVWYPTQGSTAYICSNFQAAGVVPPAGFWSVYSIPARIGFTPIALDFTQQQVLTFMWIPQNRTNRFDSGRMLHFLNGNYCAGISYGPWLSGGVEGRACTLADGGHYILAQSPGQHGTPGQMQSDYVRVFK